MEKTKPRQAANVPKASSPIRDRKPEASLHPETGKLPPTSDNSGAGQKQDSHPPGEKAHASNDLLIVFVKFVACGIESWYRAGEILVAWKKVEPDCFEKITKANPWISTATLEMFLRIGLRELHPRVLLLPPMLAERASKLTYDEQEKLCSQPMEKIRERLKRPSCEKPATGAKYRRQHQPSFAEKLPTIGFFRVSFHSSNGSPIINQCEEDASAVPIVLNENNACVIQLVSGNQSVTEAAEATTEQLQIHDALTPEERRYREFRNQK